MKLKHKDCLDLRKSRQTNSENKSIHICDRKIIIRSKLLDKALMAFSTFAV